MDRVDPRNYGVRQKKFTRLVGCEVKIMRSIFKAKLLIHHSKDNLDKKALFGKITYHLDPEVRKMRRKHKILVDDYRVCLGLSKQELMNINSFITPNDR